jgi:hypothetical protein
MRYPNLVACLAKPFSVKDLVSLVETGSATPAKAEATG